MTDQQGCWRTVVNLPVGEFEPEVTQRSPMRVWDMGSQSECVTILEQDFHTCTRPFLLRGQRWVRVVRVAWRRNERSDEFSTGAARRSSWLICRSNAHFAVFGTCAVNHIALNYSRGMSFVRRFADTPSTKSRQDGGQRSAYTDSTPILGTGTRTALG